MQDSTAEQQERLRPRMASMASHEACHAAIASLRRGSFSSQSLHRPGRKGVNTRHSNAMRAAHRVPPTAALAIACIACAHICMNRTQIHTLQHSSRTRVLPNLTMRHFTTRTQQTSQTLPTLSTHSPPHTAPHKAPGNPTMSLSTTYDEPAASSPTRDYTACNPCPLQIPSPTSYSIFTQHTFLSYAQSYQLSEPSPMIPIPTQQTYQRGNYRWLPPIEVVTTLPTGLPCLREGW